MRDTVWVIESNSGLSRVGSPKQNASFDRHKEFYQTSSGEAFSIFKSSSCVRLTERSECATLLKSVGGSLDFSVWMALDTQGI